MASRRDGSPCDGRKRSLPMPWNADVQRRRRTLGYIHLAGALPDVGRDDGGDDAAIGCPDDLDLSAALGAHTIKNVGNDVFTRL